MIKGLNCVVLTIDIPKYYRLTAGDIRTVVAAHEPSQGFEVEFVLLVEKL